MSFGGSPFGKDDESDDLWQESVVAVRESVPQLASDGAIDVTTSLYVQEPPGEVLRRIEVIVSCLIDSLAHGILPELEVVRRP